MKLSSTILFTGIASITILAAGTPVLASPVEPRIAPLAASEADEVKVEGIVSKITPKQMEVSNDDTRQRVRLTENTVYRKYKKPAEFEDLQKGDRVIVKATQIPGQPPEAIQVNIVPDTAGGR